MSDDSDGSDCSPWRADMVARDLSEAAVAPEVVAAAFGVSDPEQPIDGEGGWMPPTTQLLRNLAAHGLKVVRA